MGEKIEMTASEIIKQELGKEAGTVARLRTAANLIEDHYDLAWVSDFAVLMREAADLIEDTTRRLNAK